MRSMYTFKQMGWLVISLDEQVISQYWSEPKLGEGQGQVALLNGEGTIISATEKEWLAQPFEAHYPSVWSKLGQRV